MMVDKKYINSRYNARKTYMEFKRARTLVKKLKLNSEKEYQTAHKTGKIPNGIPFNLHDIAQYRKDWKGYSNFLGTNKPSFQKIKKLIKSFKVCRTYVRNLGIKTHREWAIYRKSEKRPIWIPTNPERHFKDEWVSWSDWFGNGKTKFWDFKKSKAWIQKSGLNIQSKPHFVRLRKLGQIPQEIPAAPQQVYSYIHVRRKKKK